MKAVLVVDFQKECEFDPLFIDKLKNKLRTAENNGYDIINIYFKHDSKNLENYISYYDGKEARKSSCYYPSSIYIEKGNYGVEDISKLSILKKYDEVIVVGGYLEACCLAVCFQLFTLDVKFKIIANLCQSHNLDVALAAKQVYSWNFGSAFDDISDSIII